MAVMPVLKTVFWDVDGTLADTEMDGHRPAFNRAFVEQGLNWAWDPETYKRLLNIPGGSLRMKTFAQQQGDVLSDAQIAQLRFKAEPLSRCSACRSCVSAPRCRPSSW